MAEKKTTQETTQTETAVLNIYQRMSAATSEISRVAKNLNVGYGKSSYKAVGEADVLAAVKPIEEKYGIYSYPISREIIDGGVLESTSEYNGQTTTKKQFYLRVATVYRFVNIDDPSDYIETTTYGDGVDSQDKAPGKAMTYGDKYALLKAYKIMTGDDPDQTASADMKNYNSKPAQRQTAPASNAANAPITEKEIEVLTNMAKSKGYEITDLFKRDLHTYTGAEYTDIVQKLAGMPAKKQ